MNNKLFTSSYCKTAFNSACMNYWRYLPVNCENFLLRRAYNIYSSTQRNSKSCKSITMLTDISC